jgi:uncharacterized membrane protein YvbJ
MQKKTNMTNKHFEKKYNENKNLEKTSCPQPCSQRLKQNACADERNHACQMTITMNITMTMTMTIATTIIIKIIIIIILFITVAASTSSTPSP